MEKWELFATHVLENVEYEKISRNDTSVYICLLCLVVLNICKGNWTCVFRSSVLCYVDNHLSKKVAFFLYLSQAPFYCHLPLLFPSVLILKFLWYFEKCAKITSKVTQSSSAVMKTRHGFRYYLNFVCQSKYFYSMWV